MRLCGGGRPTLPGHPRRRADYCGSCIRAVPRAPAPHRRDCPRRGECPRPARRQLRSWHLPSISCGKCEIESRALTRRRLDPDPAAMPFHDPPAHGQPDARARVLASGVKALKNHEDALEVLRRDADAVIADGEHAFRRARLRADMDKGSLATAELDGVADEVLQELDK